MHIILNKQSDEISGQEVMLLKFLDGKTHGFALLNLRDLTLF